MPNFLTSSCLTRSRDSDSPMSRYITCFRYGFGINTKPSKKHNRHLGNERHGSIRLFGIMLNKRSGRNVLM